LAALEVLEVLEVFFAVGISTQQPTGHQPSSTKDCGMPPRRLN
jgi:hypothetical protein